MGNLINIWFQHQANDATKLIEMWKVLNIHGCMMIEVEIERAKKKQAEITYKHIINLIRWHKWIFNLFSFNNDVTILQKRKNWFEEISQSNDRNNKSKNKKKTLKKHADLISMIMCKTMTGKRGIEGDTTNCSLLHIRWHKGFWCAQQWKRKSACK